MGRRRIEMHEYRNVLIRLRAGDGDREVARLGLMGRVKVASFREHARSLGWLEVTQALPDVQTIALSFAADTKRASSTVSKAQPWREQVARWMQAGVEGAAIHAALVREHQFRGSYSSVYRLMRDIAKTQPRNDVTVRLTFKPGEAAQSGLWCRAVSAPPGWPAQAHLGLCHDPVPQSTPVCGIRLGPDGGHMVGLPPPCV